jgi:hypothetical protein
MTIPVAPLGVELPAPEKPLCGCVCRGAARGNSGFVLIYCLEGEGRLGK